MEVRLRHLRINDWSGISKYPNCFEALGPYYTRSGRIYTGLTKEDEDRLGDSLGYDLRSGSTFWDTFRIRISSEDIVLFPDSDPMDELKYLFLKGHKRVASSRSVATPSNHYYLSNKEEEAEKTNEFSRLKRRAYQEFDKMSSSEMRKALRIYGYKADDVSDSVAEDRLGALIEANPQRFFDKWVNNQHKMTEFLIKEAVAKNVIRKNKNIHTYGTTILGRTFEESVSYLDSPENSDIKASIINDTQVK
jgi:hypothetical protein